MKKYILFAAILCLQISVHASSTHSSGAPKINARAGNRAHAHFRSVYSDVTNAHWFESGQNNMYCSFQQADISNMVFYDADGNWQYTVKSYPPAELSPLVLVFVQHHAHGYQISFIDEVISDEPEPVYLVHVENATMIKILLVSGDTYRVTTTLQKQ